MKKGKPATLWVTWCSKHGFAGYARTATAHRHIPGTEQTLCGRKLGMDVKPAAPNAQRCARCERILLAHDN